MRRPPLPVMMASAPTATNAPMPRAAFIGVLIEHADNKAGQLMSLSSMLERREHFHVSMLHVPFAHGNAPGQTHSETSSNYLCSNDG